MPDIVYFVTRLNDQIPGKKAGCIICAPFCHPDPLPGGSYRPEPATSSFKPLLGRVLRLSVLHNCSTMGTQGPNVVPPSAYGHYVPTFMG